MGQNLSEPITEKDTSLAESSRYKVGCSSMQGWRSEMEDAHTCILELSEDKGAAFFAVFDGHGGHDVAKAANLHLHKMIVNNKSYKKQKYQEAIVNGYLALDHDLLTKNQHNQSGSTAISVLLRDKKIYCGNVGDSRAIASVAGEVEPLSRDHKPNMQDEHLRIISAGGWVEFNRVNGNLALSRALGDFVYKRDTNRPQDEQIVIAKPEVTTKQLTDDHEFIVLACDGIWDVMTNEEVLEFVRNAIVEGTQPDIICEKLMTRCLAPDCRMGGVGCDNMTVVIVCLLQGQNYSDLSTKCARLSASEISRSVIRGISINHDADDDTDEWFDCTDDLPTSNGHITNHRVVSKVRRQAQDVECINEVDTVAQTQLNIETQDDAVQSSDVGNVDKDMLSDGGHHDNHIADETSAINQQVIDFKSTSV